MDCGEIQELRARGFHQRVGAALLALIRLQNFLPEAQRFRGDFDEFVVGDKFDGLFEVQLLKRDEANSFIGGRGAHVGELFLADNIDVEIRVFGVFADDHALVDFDAGADEQLSTFLQVIKRV